MSGAAGPQGAVEVDDVPDVEEASAGATQAPTHVNAAPSNAPAPPPFTPLPPPLAYMRRVLSDYYRDNVPRLPPRFGRREFGFILWPNRPGPPPFVRHLAFSTRADYEHTFRRRVPWHAYYSTAFYQKPGERRMADKVWLGAELIFDLDADHLPNAKELPLEKQLERVKVEFRRLLDDFLFGDLGFGEDDVFLTFSGGRGYHCHVTADAVLGLDSRGRRQISDYVTGKGIEERNLIRVHTEHVKDGPFDKERKRLMLPAPNAPGWSGRVGRGVVQLIEEMRVLPYDAAVERLTRYDGIGPARAQEFLDKVRETRKDAGGFDRLDRIMQGKGDQGDAIRRFLSREAVQRGVIELGEGETDEPVTADVKRLIRLPGSLHGKTGLRVVTLKADELAAFDPLRHAVALPREPQDVVVADKPAEFTIGGERFRLQPGEPQSLPRYAAFFAVARRTAAPVVPPARK